MKLRFQDYLALGSSFAMLIIHLSLIFSHKLISSYWQPLYSPFFLFIPGLFHLTINRLRPWKITKIKKNNYYLIILLMYWFLVPPYVIKADDQINGYFLN